MSKTLLVAISMVLVSGSAFAKNRLISCQNEHDKSVNLVVELNDNTLVESRMNGEVMWTFTETSISAPAKAVLANDTTEFTKSMILKAAAKESLATATLTVSTDSSGSIFEQLETVADDGAGYVLLEYKNKKGETVNGAIFAGWGGFYNKCKTVK